MGVLVCVLQLVSATILLILDVSFAATFFAFYLSGTSYMVNPVSFGWANIICQRGGDDAVGSIILYAMNAASTCLYTFWGTVLYPASDVPYWRNSGIAIIVVIFAMLGML
jgi:MFS transporter, ACS family, pantothenate transporter